MSAFKSGITDYKAIRKSMDELGLDMLPVKYSNLLCGRLNTGSGSCAKCGLAASDQNSKCPVLNEDDGKNHAVPVTF